MSNKWAIKIRMGDGDWLYVTEDNDRCWDLQPQLYETFEQAEQAASVWRLKSKEINVKVVKYES
jgi:hypothetical protein